MGYKSIMVSVDTSEASAKRLRVAVALADRFQSKIIGVASETFIPVFTYDTPAFDLTEEMRLAAEETIAEAEASFRAIVPTTCASEFRSDFDFPAFFLARQARVAELVIVGGHGGTELYPSLVVHTGDLVMRVGRPLLVVPPDCDHLAGKRVVVAWRDTREARRAFWDAMPFIEAADEVYVASFGDRRDEDGARDITQMLIARGVCAVPVVRDVQEGSVAQALFEVATDHRADLIVAGAYGHNRLREWILGGVTRDLILRSPVCCLLAH